MRSRQEYGTPAAGGRNEECGVIDGAVIGVAGGLAWGKQGTVIMRLRRQDRAAVLAIVLASGLTGASLLGQSAGVAAWVDCLGDSRSTLSVESVAACLEAGAGPMARAEDGATILHFVARDGDAGAVEALLAAGAHVMARDADGETPLHEAAWNEVNVVEALLAAGADVMARAENGETPLYGAAGARNLVAVEVLLAAGADPMARGGPGWTPLHWAASGSDPAMAEVLLAAGADVMARGAWDGRTPLHNAQSPAVIEVLLQAGADVGARDVDGMTPLHHAADLCCRDCGGSCWSARVFGDSDDDLRGIESRIDALRALLAAGGDPDPRDGLGLDAPSHGCGGVDGRVEQPALSIRDHRRRQGVAGGWGRRERAEQRWRNAVRSRGAGVRCLLAVERRTLQRAALTAPSLARSRGRARSCGRE